MEEPDTKNKIIISESTPVRIGLIAAFLGIFGASIWWASSINSKLDSILSFQSSVNTSIAELKASDLSTAKEINDIKLKQAIEEVALKDLRENSKK